MPGMFFTPATVDKNTGKKPARKIITIAGTSPIPNPRTIKGIQAIGDIGRIICSTGFMNLNRIPIRPKISPKATATTVEETNPTKKRYMLLVIWSASEPSPIISMKASQVFTGFGKSAVFTPVRVQISCQTAISRITDEMLKPIFPAFLELQRFCTFLLSLVDPL